MAIGRAIVCRPQLFLFDEPLSNLDSKLRTQMRSEILSLLRRLGTTMIYVTHDQAEAMTMGNKIIIMRQGQVQQTGLPADLYQRPANTFVATFLGSPSMNLVHGRVIDHDGLRFESEDFSVELPEWPSLSRRH